MRHKFPEGRGLWNQEEWLLKVLLWRTLLKSGRELAAVTVTKEESRWQRAEGVGCLARSKGFRGGDGSEEASKSKGGPFPAPALQGTAV